ncbi:hypothetical protein AMELA_G00226110 [Ameiurus melas]|uniref:Uncharacterized protein n=1 Tax=Ameiurus melas TaxID=219545 RepID=A0A7J5ZZK9_AMEME|nr:hypothetical protein AMELA_G00226110 [Ameiurus melas]
MAPDKGGTLASCVCTLAEVCSLTGPLVRSRPQPSGDWKVKKGTKSGSRETKHLSMLLNAISKNIVNSQGSRQIELDEMVGNPINRRSFKGCAGFQ